ncbi:unnamed protein product [Echinostoma caproni]|uniref:Dynein light chain n=1 Tax=Echinostoma caproni TaxID=27848 RepID=A0A183AAR2_9TREM|nr:unnamed protein product [Echinostoma caproni]
MTMSTGQEQALIKYSEMNQQQQQEAVDCSAAAIERFQDNQEVAKYIKHEFDRRYGGTWHCVVGKTFGW